MTSWLLKTEPNAFSFDDLVQRDVEPWDGVTNFAALKNMRSAEVGDRCVIYHTGDERQAVGMATVARTFYPDPKQQDPKLIVIDVKVGERLAHPVTLSVLKTDPRFHESPLVKQGRLSVVPLTDEQVDAIVELGGGLTPAK